MNPNFIHPCLVKDGAKRRNLRRWAKALESGRQVTVPKTFKGE